VSRLITWRPTTAPDREPQYAEVLRELTDCVYIHPETGKDRWIPEHWIIDDEEA
jgi:hypothetical protein